MSSLQKKQLEKKVNRCNVCLKTVLGGSYHMKAHLYQHNAIESRFKCSLCPKEYYRSDVFARHMKTHSATKKVYICDHCDRSFINKRNLLLHLKVHDDNLRRDYKCVACGVIYCEARLLRYHIRKTHYNLQDNPVSSTKKLNESWVEPVKKTAVCVQLTKVTDNILCIKKYGPLKQEDTSADKRNSNEYITSVFAQTDNSHYSKAKCDYCHKEMLKKSLLPHIRERHLKIKPFKCDVCSRMFNRHYQLVDHVCGKPIRRKRKAES